MNEKIVNYSVIIPHFTKNGNVDLLQRAVRSIPDRDDIQVIVSDNSIEHIPNDLFIDRKNVTIIYTPNERKAGGARNDGLAISVGKWLLFLDADDFFNPDAFSITDDYLNCEDDIIFFVPDSVYSDDIEKKADRADNLEGKVKKYLETGDGKGLRLSYPVPWSKMIRSSMVKEANILFEEVPASNDVMFSLLTGLKAKSITADLRKIYTVTVNHGSITRTLSLENINSKFGVNQRRNRVLKENGYKKDASVMLLLIQSAKYGVKPFCKLFASAVMSGDLLVGASNWLTTASHFRTAYIKNDKKKYNVTEL